MSPSRPAILRRLSAMSIPPGDSTPAFSYACSSVNQEIDRAAIAPARVRQGWGRMAAGR
jgi:hypothetical protein